ncbi:MAG: PAS domain S-box protein, partial [Proteobacteria bacterium]|nr:PAS domain S-box protein [Pseudomonadota bacterium]
MTTGPTYEDLLKKVETLEAKKKALETENEALKSAEKRFSLFAEHLNAVLWIGAPHRPGVLYISPAFEKIYGRPSDPVYESPRLILNYVHPDDRERVLDILRASYPDHWEVEYRIVRPDGTERWVCDRGRTVRDPDGKVLWLFGVVTDETDCKRAELALVELEELYKNILDSITEGVQALDTNYCYTLYNSAMERISRVPRDRLIGTNRTLWEFFPEFHKRGIDHLIKGAMAGQAGHAERIPYKLPDGTRGWTDETFVPLRFAGGEIRGVVSVVREVTLQKQAEDELKAARDELEQRVAARTADLIEANQRLQNEIEERTRAQEELVFLRQAVDGAMDAIGIADAPDHVIYLNQSFMDLTGYGLESLNRAGGVLALHEETFNRDIQAEIKSRQRSWQSEAELKTPGGDRIPVELKVGAFFDRGELKGYIAIIRDIRARKQADEQLRLSMERYSTLFNGITDAVLVSHVGEDGQPGSAIDANEAACHLLGYDREELLSLKFNDIIPDDSPLELDRLIQKFRVDRRVLFDQLVVRKDGTRLPVEIHSRVIRLGGRPAILSTARDVTERKRAEAALRESEERFRTAFEFAVIGRALLTFNGRYIKVNEAFCQMVGRTAEELLGRSWRTIVDAEDHAAASTEVRKA